MIQINTETLNSRLLQGHRLLVTRDKDRVVAVEIEFFDEGVPVALFESYLSNGMIEPPKDGLGFKVSALGKKQLRAHPRRGA